MRSIVLGLTLLGITLPTDVLANPGGAIRACIRDALSQSRPLQTKKVSGQQKFAVLLSCSSDVAQTLYDAVRTVAREHGPFTDADSKDEIIARYFGDVSSSVPSQCIRVTRLASGASANRFTCYIGIDLSSVIMQSLADAN
jgi:hypothetical protein